MAINYQTATEAARAYRACRRHLASLGLCDPYIEKLEADWYRKSLELMNEQIEEDRKREERPHKKDARNEDCFEVSS